MVSPSLFRVYCITERGTSFHIYSKNIGYVFHLEQIISTFLGQDNHDGEHGNAAQSSILKITPT